jgi:glycosyltransferase involved in cell wall biosynthesis
VTRALKVLQITNRLPFPLNDGGNIATYNVTKYLNRFGHSVVLASLNTQKHYQDPSTLAHLAEVHTVDLDTSVKPFGLFKGLFTSMPYNIKRFISPDFSVLLEKLVKEEKPDIIQLEGIYLAIYVTSLKKYSTAPVLLRSHNVEYEIWERTAENESNVLKKYYLKDLSRKIKAFEKANMHLFDGIMAITARDLKFYKENKYLGKLKTIPAGVDLELMPSSPPRKNTEMSLCFLGSMEWMPNVQGVDWYLENVWPKLHKKYPGLTFHVAGKNMSEEMKGRRIEGVLFHGTVPDASAFLRQHSVMIVPLLSGGGMRLKIIEAMAHGLCILSSVIGAEGIEAEKDKEIIIANTPEEFIIKTEALLTKKLEAAAIGAQAQKLVVEKYSWEKLVREIEKFYLEHL